MTPREFITSLSKEQFKVVYRLWINWVKAMKFIHKVEKVTKREIKIDDEWMFDMMIAIDDVFDKMSKDGNE